MNLSSPSGLRNHQFRNTSSRENKVRSKNSNVVSLPSFPHPCPLHPLLSKKRNSFQAWSVRQTPFLDLPNYRHHSFSVSSFSETPLSMKSLQDPDNQRSLLLALYHLIKFLGLLYYIISIPFRLSFHPIPFSATPSTSSFPILCIDYLVDLFYFVDYFWDEYSHHGSSKIIPIDSNLDSLETLSIDFMKASRRNSASSLGELYTTQKYIFLNWKLGLQLLCTFPMEIVAYLAGYPFYLWFRLNRYFRLCYALCYWSNLTKAIESLHVLIIYWQSTPCNMKSKPLLG